MAPTPKQSLDEIFEMHPITDLQKSSWTISLGSRAWKKPFLMLCVFEPVPSGAMTWVNYGRIDVFRRGDEIVNMLITTKESSILIAVDVERFSSTASSCYLDEDVDQIIATIKKLAIEERYQDVAGKIAGFIFEHHSSTLKSAIRKAREIMQKSLSGKTAADVVTVGGPSGAASVSLPSDFPENIVTVVWPPPSRGQGGSGGGSQVPRSSQGKAATGGSARAATGARSSKKRPYLVISTDPFSFHNSFIIVGHLRGTIYYIFSF